MKILLHILAAIILFATAASTLMTIRLILEYTLSNKPNKYPLWLLGCSVGWAVFYLLA